MKIISILLLAVFVLFLQTIRAQENQGLQRFKTKGFLVGYGKAVNKETNYKIIYLAGDFSWSFKKYPKKNFFAAWYFEPQVNPVRSNRPWDIEFGTNLGIRTYWKINNGFYFYQMLGSGPHFITADVKRQAKGFIFSDNAALGFMRSLEKKNLFINMQLRWRHISNAGLKDPNGGVDSWNVFVGISKLY
jgi:hypothetical protein